jgi:hypothetical protein
MLTFIEYKLFSVRIIAENSLIFLSIFQFSVYYLEDIEVFHPDPLLRNQ